MKPNVVYGISDGIQMNANMAYDIEPQSQDQSPGVDLPTEQLSAEDEVQVMPNVVYGIPDGIQMNANMVYDIKPQSATEDSYDYVSYYSTIAT